MGDHTHKEHPWRVRVDDERGEPHGAGVLLDGRHVLTCAHVVADAGGPGGGMRVRSVACAPEWTRTARVVPDAWVVQRGTRSGDRVPRGDVTLLELAEPVRCAARLSLWRVPLSGGRARAYGFKATALDGIWAFAELAGAGGYRAELGQLTRLPGRTQFIVPGFSGAGVVAQDGEFDGRLIGIVVARHVDADVDAAWMLPTETILGYLPRLDGYAAGSRTNAFGAAESPVGGGDVLGDPLRLALTQELTRLLRSDWTGTVVVGTGTTTSAGASWLVRLVRTADPAARVSMSDDELTGPAEDTVLNPGTIDAAYDASGKTLPEVRAYLTERFGLTPDGDLPMQLARRRPPPCLVVGGVDRAADGPALVHDLLAPLARRARSRGLRLVLGCVGRPPKQLPYDVFLDPEPFPAAGPGTADTGQVQAALDALCAAENEALRRHLRWGVKFFAAPRLPPPAAPRVRVRLAVARHTEPNAELAAARAHAIRARAAAEDYAHTSARTADAWRGLVRELDLHRVRAAGRFGAEDQALAAVYGPAARALHHEPVDLTAARRAVARYVRAVDHRVAEADGHGPGGPDAGERGEGDA